MQVDQLQYDAGVLWVGFLITAIAAMILCPSLPTYVFRVKRRAMMRERGEKGGEGVEEGGEREGEAKEEDADGEEGNEHGEDGKDAQ